MTAYEAGALKADLMEGTPDGRPPLVLLHGLTFDRTMWRPALTELSRIDRGRQVLALDLPGHGDSPAWPRYDIASAADAVREAVRWTRLDPPVLVGHSLAALVAMEYAARYPARGVVNVDAWLDIESTVALVQSMASEIRGGGFAEAWKLFEDSMHIEMLPARARRLLRPASDVRQEVVAGYWREMMDRPALEVAARVASIMAALRAKRIGYLFVAGHPVEIDYLDWLSQRMPGAAVQVMLDSGHFPQLAHPKRFAECLAATAAWAAPERRDGAA